MAPSTFAQWASVDKLPVRHSSKSDGGSESRLWRDERARNKFLSGLYSDTPTCHGGSFSEDGYVPKEQELTAYVDTPQ